MKKHIKRILQLGTITSIALSAVAISCSSHEGSPKQGVGGSTEGSESVIGKIDFNALDSHPISNYDYDTLHKNSTTNYDSATKSLTLDLASIFHFSDSFPAVKSMIDVSELNQIVQKANGDNISTNIKTATGATLDVPYFSYGYYTHARNGKKLNNPGFYHVMPQTENGSVNTKSDQSATEVWNHPFLDAQPTTTSYLDDVKAEIENINQEAIANGSEYIGSLVGFTHVDGTAASSTKDETNILDMQIAYGNTRFKVGYSFYNEYKDLVTGKTGPLTNPGFYLAKPFNPAGDGSKVFMEWDEIGGYYIVNADTNRLDPKNIVQDGDGLKIKLQFHTTYDMPYDYDDIADWQASIIPDEDWAGDYSFNPEFLTKKTLPTAGEVNIMSIPSIELVQNTNKLYRFDYQTKKFIIDEKTSLSIDDMNILKYIQPSQLSIETIESEGQYWENVRNLASKIHFMNSTYQLSTFYGLAGLTPSPIRYFMDKNYPLVDSDKVFFEKMTMYKPEDNKFLSTILNDSGRSTNIKIIKSWNGKLGSTITDSGTSTNYKLYVKSADGKELSKYLWGFYKSEPNDEADATSKMFSTGSTIEAFSINFRKFGKTIIVIDDAGQQIHYTYKDINLANLKYEMEFNPSEQYISNSGIELMPRPLDYTKGIMDAGFSPSATNTSSMGTEDLYIGDEIINSCDYIESATEKYFTRSYFTHDGTKDLIAEMNSSTKSPEELIIEYSKYELPQILKGIYSENVKIDYAEYKMIVDSGDRDDYKNFIKKYLKKRMIFNGQNPIHYDDEVYQEQFPAGLKMHVTFLPIFTTYAQSIWARFTPQQQDDPKATPWLANNHGKESISSTESMMTVIYSTDIKGLKWPFANKINLKFNWGDKTLETINDFNSRQLFNLVIFMQKEFKLWTKDYISLVKFFENYGANFQDDSTSSIFSMFDTSTADNIWTKIGKILKGFITNKGGNHEAQTI